MCRHPHHCLVETESCSWSDFGLEIVCTSGTLRAPQTIQRCLLPGSLSSNRAASRYMAQVTNIMDHRYQVDDRPAAENSRYDQVVPLGKQKNLASQILRVRTVCLKHSDQGTRTVSVVMHFCVHKLVFLHSTTSAVSSTPALECAELCLTARQQDSVRHKHRPYRSCAS